MKELEKMFNKYQNMEVRVSDLINRIPIKEGHRIILFQLQEIVDFSVLNNHVFLTDKSGSEFLADLNLKELEEKLPDSFKRIHRSTIVNTDLVTEVRKLDNGKFEIMMNCDKQRVLACSKNYNDNIKSLINL